MGISPANESDPGAVMSYVKYNTIVVQVNGVSQDILDVTPMTDNSALEDMALDLPRIKELTEGKEIKKVIVIPDKLVSIIAK